MIWLLVTNAVAPVSAFLFVYFEKGLCISVFGCILFVLNFLSMFGAFVYAQYNMRSIGRFSIEQRIAIVYISC